jgi:hypothetical protein
MSSQLTFASHPAPASSHPPAKAASPTLIKYFSFTGQMLVKYLLFTGQIPVKYFSLTGQIPVKYWSNTGRTRSASASTLAQPYCGFGVGVFDRYLTII